MRSLTGSFISFIAFKLTPPKPEFIVSISQGTEEFPGTPSDFQSSRKRNLSMPGKFSPIPEDRSPALMDGQIRRSQAVNVLSSAHGHPAKVKRTSEPGRLCSWLISRLKEKGQGVSAGCHVHLEICAP